jgi:Bacterial SH3 domain/GW (Gly-Tryp) dipeptide domain
MKSLNVFQAALITTITTGTIVVLSAVSALATPGRISSMGEVNVRSQPTTASSVIAYAYNGESIDIQSEQINRQDGYGWYRVRLGNQNAMGWIRADLVSFGGTGGGPVGGGTGGGIERGDLVQLRSGQGNRLISVRDNPSFNAVVKFSGQNSDQVRVEQVVRNRDGVWFLISYPNALRSVVSSGWVHSDQVR